MFRRHLLHEVHKTSSHESRVSLTQLPLPTTTQLQLAAARSQFLLEPQVEEGEEWASCYHPPPPPGHVTYQKNPGIIMKRQEDWSFPGLFCPLRGDSLTGASSGNSHCMTCYYVTCSVGVAHGVCIYIYLFAVRLSHRDSR